MHNPRCARRIPTPARVLLLVSLLVVSPSLREPSLAQTSADVSLRVMSFNIRYPNPDDGVHYWPNRRRHVTDLLRYYDADVVGLQEVLDGPLHEIVGALDGYDWIGVGREDGRKAGEYAPIFFRAKRLESLEWGTEWLSETPADTGSVGWDASLPRIATWARFRERESGQELFVLNTHFDHRGEKAREESARLVRTIVAERAGKLPAVVMGDFNSTPRSRAYRILTSGGTSGQPLGDARKLCRIGPFGPEGTSGGFVAGPRPGNQIDYVFVANGVNVAFFASLPDHRGLRYPSDHRPVMADLEIPVGS